MDVASALLALVAELGEVTYNRGLGRQSPIDRTVFNALARAVMAIVPADARYRNAQTERPPP